MFGPDDRGGAVVFLEPLVDDQPAVPEILGHRRAWVWRGVLDVRPVHISSGEFKVGFDRLAGVTGAADDEPADHDHFVPMQMVNGLKCRIPRFPPVLALAVLGFGSEEPQVLFKDVLDAEEDVAEAGLPHQPGEPLAVVGDGRGHRYRACYSVFACGGPYAPRIRCAP